jgi:RNA polymerase sigma-70 factor (sigma-E family)
MAFPTWDGVMAPAVAEADRWTADEAVTRLFAAHYRQLVRLAALLLGETGIAEEVVQDAYVRLHQHWWRLREPDRALGYLRTSVVNGARSALRHRGVAQRYAAGLRPPADMPSAEMQVLDSVENATLLHALRRLPARQRETLVLRYYADLSEAEIAEAMGISRGAVKSHAARGIAALRQTVERMS